MKTIIAGSREINDYEFLKKVIKESEFEITEVISGTARGVDKLGERFAEENHISVKKISCRMGQIWKISWTN
jgi:predicted Rossmann fold nucleotide-binding protein DprA/Smf involved in DNA uptake